MKLRLRWFVVVFAWLSGILISQDILAQDSFDTQPEFTVASFVKSVQVFPNPAVDYVHIRVDHADIAKVQFTLHNIIGNRVDVESEVIDQHELRIRVKDLSIGYYLISLKDTESNLSGTIKFVKK